MAWELPEGRRGWRLTCQVLRTGLGALHNRVELWSVEWQQERVRRVEAVVMAMVFVFLGCMAMGILTAIVIFLCPEESRLWVAGGLMVAYLIGASWAALSLRGLLRRAPFAHSLKQLQKDREWLDSLK